MSRCFRSSTVIFAVILGATWSAPASAALILSFDSSSYTTALGQSVAVQVFVSQVAGGVQVAAGNELLSGSVELAFATTGAATLAGSNPVIFGSAWDTGLASTTNRGANTVYDVSLLSLTGIADLSSRLLLATFNFTGVAPGTQMIQVSQQDPTSVDFVTAQGSAVDPTNIPTAAIMVAPAAVPEPGSIVLIGLAALAIFPASRRRRLA